MFGSAGLAPTGHGGKTGFRARDEYDDDDDADVADEDEDAGPGFKRDAISLDQVSSTFFPWPEFMLIILV